jgi:hypothetical protein
MDIAIVILRLIHIPAAVLWVAANLAMTLWISPSANAVGKDAAPFMNQFSYRSNYGKHVIGGALTTVLSGLALYWLLFQGINVSTTSGLMLTTGGLLGIGALGHGLAVVKPLTDKMRALAGHMAAAGGPPSEAMVMEMNAMREKAAKNGVILTITVVLALVFMTLSERLVL